jgi:hypothetical protein
LLANHSYSLALDGGVTATDAVGYALDTTGGAATGGGGIINTFYNGVAYRTASGGAPGNPTSLLLSVNGNAQGNMDYLDAITGANTMRLSWLAPSSGQVSRYNVYVATGSGGPWMFLTSTTVNAVTSSMTNINAALYGATYNPECLDKLAFVTDTVHVKVCAWNAEGESTGVATSERDAVEPGVVVVARQNPANMVPLSGAGIAASLTDYSAAANLDMGCYITFTEPMDVSTLTDATKYTPTVGSVTSATVVFNSGGSTVVELVFSVANPPANTVTVSGSGPADLSGNTVDTTTPANIAAIVI